MDWYNDYKLTKEAEGYTLVITLNPDSTEFSKELITSFKENVLELDDQIKKLVQDKFSDIKVNAVKLVLGTMVVASIPFAHHTKVHAAELTSNQQNPSTAANTTDLNTTGTVTASKLNVRVGPSTSNAIMHVLWQGNKVKVIGKSAGWYKIQLSDGRIGWVSETYLKVDQRLGKISTVINTANSLLGTPYVWGGESPAEGGFDCSGFTQYVFGKAGYSLNRVSSQQALQGTTVSKSDLQPGDLVFFSFEGNGSVNHVGIYVGNGQMIHSPKAGDVVKKTDMTTSYWQTRMVTAKRIF